MHPPTQESLRDGLGQSGQSAQFKAISQLDVHCENVLAVSPSAVVAAASANGSCDTGPRGGPPGFIRALSPTRVAIGELPGNRLFDEAQNIAENPSAALLVMIPGINEPLLIEGRAQWIHQDVDGEMLNNSFAAIAPSGRWFVRSEWDQVSRPLVYPTPGLNPTARDRRRNLPLAATIALTRPVRSVQGCSFSTPTVLSCAATDPRTDLFPVTRQLLRIDLAHALDGHRDVGIPHALGTVPQHSGCPGAGQVKGLDVSGPTLTVVVNEPNLRHNRSVLPTYTGLPGTTPGQGRHLPSIAPPRNRRVSRAASVGRGMTPHLSIRITPRRNQPRRSVPGARAAGGHAPAMLRANR